MKRWVVVLLVVLAAVVLVSPGIVGRLAERNLESNLEWAAQEAGATALTGGSFDRGWFTSEGTRRIEIRHPDLRSIVAAVADVRATADAPPVLVVTTRLDHGLIPVTSMARESGSLAPALASAVSTLALEPGNGETIEIPGTIVTRVGLTGTSTSHYRLDPGAFDDGSTRVEWQGADVTVRLDAGGSTVGFDAVIEPVDAAWPGEELAFGRIAFDGEQRKTQYGFNVGTVHAEIASLGGSGDRGVGAMSLTTVSELAGERVNGRTTLGVDDLVVPGVGTVNIDADMAVDGLDAASLQAILAAIEQAQGAAAPEEALAAAYPAVEDDVRRLLAAGAALRVEQLDVGLPQGLVTSKLHVELPETDLSAFTWAGALLALTATADIAVPVEAMDFVLTLNPQANALIAMGFLKKEGDAYRLQAKYAKGLLTVNGAPMPIPLPAAAR